MSNKPDKVEIHELCFGYGSEVLFQNVCFSLREGDFAALIGPNGAGKSTFLRLLLGELTPKSGSIKILGEDINEFRRWSEIGYLPQNNTVKGTGFPVTVEEIIAASLYKGLRGFHMSKRRRQMALEALASVGMDNSRGKLMGELSGGQQQRVLLARALVSEPQLMLLDEPTGGVDNESVDALYKLLAKLNSENGLTLLMVTHETARILEYVNRVFCLEQGSLVELSKDQIQEELSHKHSHDHSEEGGCESHHGDS